MSLWLLIAMPAVAGAVLALLGPPADRFGAPVAMLVCVATIGLALGSGTGQQASAPFLLGAGLDLGMDGLSLALVVTVCVVTACVLAAVPTLVDRRVGRLSGWLLLFLAAVLLTLAARSLLPLLIAWELMGAASYVLIAHDVGDRRAAGSATSALVTTRALDLGLYLAAGAALAGGGSLELDGLAALPDGWRDAAALGVVAAALGKAAQLPVSWWLSRAMDGPSPVSALLHSAAMVAMGGYLLLRTGPLLVASGWADDVVAWTGALTAIALGVVALAQRDLKQLLAASTASQLGLVVLAAGVAAREAGAAQLVAHAAVKSLLFLVAGIWLHALHTRDLGRLTGAAWRTPAVGVLAALGLSSLAGLPPFALWASKDAVLDAALERSVALYAAGLLAALLSAAYAGRALALLLRIADDDAVQPHSVPVPLTAWAPLVPLAVGAVALGAVSTGAGGKAFGRLVGSEPVAAALPGLVLSAALAATVLALVWTHGETLADRLGGAPRQWLHLEAVTHAIAVRPVLVLARALARFDDEVLDRAVMGAAARTRSLSGVLARADDRVLDGAVEGTAAGTIRLAGRSGRLDERGVDGTVRGVADVIQQLAAQARRPQTGQVHQYYAQAAVVLVVATVLLLIAR